MIYREWFVNFRFPGHERTGAQDIASTGEASSDQGKSDKPVRREVA
jgi:hypothetical protein